VKCVLLQYPIIRVKSSESSHLTFCFIQPRGFCNLNIIYIKIFLIYLERIAVGYTYKKNSLKFYRVAEISKSGPTVPRVMQPDWSMSAHQLSSRI